MQVSEYNKTIKLRISEEMLNSLQRMCKAKGISVSEYIRNCIADGLKARK